MKNTEENREESEYKDKNMLLEEYKILREDKNHHDTLIWQILYFYFAIAPLFLLVGGTLEEDYHGALLASIIFNVILGLFTVFALLNHRGFWNYAITRAKEIEKEPNFGMKHFSEYEDRYEVIGLGLERSKINKECLFIFKLRSRLFWAIIILSLFLATLTSLGIYHYLPNEITILKIIISLLVFIIFLLLLWYFTFHTEYNRIKNLK